MSELLRAWGKGDLQARDDLPPFLYRELRQQAAGFLRHEPAGHPSADRARERGLPQAGRAAPRHLAEPRALGVAAQMMRRVLVDHGARVPPRNAPGARSRCRWTTASGRRRSLAVATCSRSIRLSTSSRRSISAWSRSSSFGAFAGLTEQEVAEVLSISRATVTREWQTARAWLYRRMTAGEPGPV